MWPATTKSKISHNVGPSSPPQTPRTASPVFGRKSSPRPGELPPQVPLSGPMAPPLPSTRQTAVNGGGPHLHHDHLDHLDHAGGHDHQDHRHQHTHHHHHHSNHHHHHNHSAAAAAAAIRPGQLSPHATSSSSSASSSDSSDSDDDSNAAAPDPSPLSAATDGRPAPAPLPRQARIGRVVTHTEFIVEELSDFGDSDAERPGVIRPCAIEYPESDRSRSTSRNRPEIDQRMMYNLGNLNCSDDSDETDLDEHEYREFLIKRRAERRRMRMSSGSIGKRSFCETMGSDTDREDIRSMLGAEEAGSTARRLRRRIGDRRSLQFQDPQPPRIDELDEPGDSDDGIFIGESLARELPYYEYVSMEVDSP